ncbi:MAG: hypothetical protein ABGZ35_20125 [Planctomycetaceae bacterium]|jgi:hypothetical protein
MFASAAFENKPSAVEDISIMNSPHGRPDSGRHVATGEMTVPNVPFFQ